MRPSRTHSIDDAAVAEGAVVRQQAVTRPGQIVLASGNPGKLAEIGELLAPLGVELVPQSRFKIAAADESGATFAENAEIKARHAALATGLPSIADDSGLVVAALDGAPGVRSARYAGENASDRDNVVKLIDALRDLPEERRDAVFECVACFVRPGVPEAIFATGKWRGRILTRRRGEGGFGYDPVFYDIDLDRSAAEMTAEEKNLRSHRGKAMRALVRKLKDLW